MKHPPAFPPELVDIAWDYRLRSLGCFGPFFLLSGAACTSTLAGLCAASGGAAHVAGLVVASLLFMWFGAILAEDLTLRRWRGRARVVPYFEAPVGAHTFTSGYALARDWQRLDRIAELVHACPLSTFGFSDDLRGDRLIWHPATEGQQTVRVLRGMLQSSAYDDWPNVGPLVRELRQVEHALGRAAKEDVGFCFVLCVPDGLSLAPPELRRGTFF